jgi:hypothetical protein
MTGSEGARPSGTNRRTVVKGAAWAVPAVAVASAAPAVAASPCLTAEFLGDSCKQPGSGNNFGYRLQICFTNTCATSVTITVTQVAANVGNPVVTQVNQTITIPAGAEDVCLPEDVLYCSNSSANFINVSYTIQGQQGTLVAKVPSPVQECRPEDQFCN